MYVSTLIQVGISILLFLLLKPVALILYTHTTCKQKTEKPMQIEEMDQYLQQLLQPPQDLWSYRSQVRWQRIFEQYLPSKPDQSWCWSWTNFAILTHSTTLLWSSLKKISQRTQKVWSFRFSITLSWPLRILVTRLLCTFNRVYRPSWLCLKIECLINNLHKNLVFRIFKEFSAQLFVFNNK